MVDTPSTYKQPDAGIQNIDMHIPPTHNRPGVGMHLEMHTPQAQNQRSEGLQQNKNDIRASSSKVNTPQSQAMDRPPASSKPNSQEWHLTDTPSEHNQANGGTQQPKTDNLPLYKRPNVAIPGGIHQVDMHIHPPRNQPGAGMHLEMHTPPVQTQGNLLN